MNWSTKEDTVKNIKSMDDSHLLNALRVTVENHIELSRSIENAQEMEAFLNSDMADYGIISDIRRLERMEQSYIETEDLLRQEVRNRNLKELPPRKSRIDVKQGLIW